MFIFQALTDPSWESLDSFFFFFFSHVFFLTHHCRGSLQRENKQRGGRGPLGQLGGGAPSSQGPHALRRGSQRRAGRAGQAAEQKDKPDGDRPILPPLSTRGALEEDGGCWDELFGGCRGYGHSMEGEFLIAVSPRWVGRCPQWKGPPWAALSGAALGPEAAEGGCGAPALSPAFPPFVSSTSPSASRNVMGEGPVKSPVPLR